MDRSLYLLIGASSCYEGRATGGNVAALPPLGNEQGTKYRLWTVVVSTFFLNL